VGVGGSVDLVVAVRAVAVRAVAGEESHDSKRG
jgi:hypothetical protein